MPQCCPAQLKTLKRFVCAQAFLCLAGQWAFRKIEHDPFRKCVSMTIWWWMNHAELLNKLSIWLMDVFPPFCVIADVFTYGRGYISMTNSFLLVLYTK
jgi:hypothetical protein